MAEGQAADARMELELVNALPSTVPRCVLLVSYPSGKLRNLDKTTEGQMSEKVADYLRNGWMILALVVTSLVPATTAKAEIISLSAADFQLQCPPCGVNAADYTFDNGLLEPADLSHFYATVPFPTNGLRVCSFTLVYQDINATDPLVAQLWKKPFAVGSNPTAAPIIMANVTSAVGVLTSVRKVTDTTINQPIIAQSNGFYIAHVFAETNNLNFLGVQIEFKSVCP